MRKVDKCTMMMGRSTARACARRAGTPSVEQDANALSWRKRARTRQAEALYRKALPTRVYGMDRATRGPDLMDY